MSIGQHAPRILQLSCPACDARINPEEVNIRLGVAKCVACGAVMSLADQLAAGTMVPPGPLTRPEVPLPPKIRVEQWGHELSMSWRWFTAVVLFLVFFCIAWDSFLVFWYSMAVMVEGMGPARWLMIIFPVAHVAVGVGLTYFVIASLFNRTRIQVRGEQLTVRHGPVPWKGNVSLPAAEIEQIFCTQKVTSGKNGDTWAYRVNAMLTDGRKVELVSNLPDADMALYIEQTLENHLQIVDRPVGGEMTGSRI